ncbi:DUF2252 domain-containing protein [Actinospica sp. MGRD01-02]|uniref:DUF2252 domain-containing protein n=1 Tax=Actinospica acidithermotolerans TaxID=2828514 RepID=A0A941EID3_9ACTN|nr:DUF2252 domain-containing protein [Actinospica acidithermotolerans]MBR7831082.1 DUF2252 domain-containing protein [Actinospica acidithermotolerans]
MTTTTAALTSAGQGITARDLVPPAAHAEVPASVRDRDPIAILERQDADRVPELVPIRHGRMLASPFAFYRGGAAIMASDLAGTPDSGLHVQACGDAHLANFGLFASPERRLVFDVNDFDETHPGPWEWDVKRLAASLEIAARGNGFGRKHRRAIQMAAVRSYQHAMLEFAGMHELDVWYAQGDVHEIKKTLKDQLKKARRKAVDKSIAHARTRNSRRAMGKLTKLVDGRQRIVADPPLVVPVRDLLPPEELARFEAKIQRLLHSYRKTLQPDRRVLLNKFDYVDMARKVVGVGSVGTRCWITLMFGRDDDDPLFLQIKEAQRSVLEEYGGMKPDPRHAGCQGKRVVDGQRLMQAASDIFLGWESTEGIDGVRRDFYVRQLADWKGSANIEDMVPRDMIDYGKLCGWTLARAHARSGDRVAIAAYLGDDATFAHAIAEFSAAYADQNERDYAAMRAAMRSGRIAVEPDCR